MTKPSISELDLARVAKYCHAKVPAYAREELRIEYKVRGRSVTIFDCRPLWHESVGPEWSRLPVAQLRFDPERGEWTLFCRDRNSRWHTTSLSREASPNYSPRSMLTQPGSSGDRIPSDPKSPFTGVPVTSE
jgi:hypothetical protein